MFRLFLFYALLAALAVLPAAAAAGSEKPNVLIVFPDQWRRQAIGVNGDPNVHTPNLDRLAAHGTNFLRCYTTNPVCSPARATFQTGRYPHQTGLIQNNLYLREGEVCLAEQFARSGYATGYIGKWHLDGPPRPGFVAPPRRQGYEVFEGFNRGHWYPTGAKYFSDDGKLIEPDEYESIYQTDLAIRFMRRLHESGKPFMLFLAYGPPHTPYRPPAAFDRFKPEDLTWRKNVTPEERNKPSTASGLAGYYGLCEMLDHQLGRMLQFLDESGLAGSTVVFFTSDHGDSHGSHGLHHKGQPEEESLAIPLIVRAPGGKPGQRSDTLVSTVDFAPTILSLCGIDVPEPMVGRDFSPVIMGRSIEAPWVYTEGRMSRSRPKEAAKTKRRQQEGAAKAKRTKKAGQRPTVARTIPGPWRAIVTPQYKLAVDQSGVRLLVDLENDPLELNNLAGKPEHHELEEKLITHLKEVGEQLGDPFPEPVPPAPAQW